MFELGSEYTLHCSNQQLLLSTHNLHVHQLHEGAQDEANLHLLSAPGVGQYDEYLVTGSWNWSLVTQ